MKVWWTNPGTMSRGFSKTALNAPDQMACVHAGQNAFPQCMQRTLFRSKGEALVTRPSQYGREQLLFMFIPIPLCGVYDLPNCCQFIDESSRILYIHYVFRVYGNNEKPGSLGLWAKNWCRLTWSPS